jgi:hypothetical protein
MGVLTNPKWERFAQELAKGITPEDAYAKAGFKAHRQNAHRLMTNDDIKSRVAEILERAAIRTEITIERLTEMLLEDREGARLAGQFAAAKGAVDSLAKLHGLWVDRHENKNKYELMTDAELDAEINRFYLKWEGRKNAAPGDGSTGTEH